MPYPDLTYAGPANTTPVCTGTSGSTVMAEANNRLLHLFPVQTAMKKTFALLCFSLSLFSSAGMAQSLQKRVDAIVASHQTRVGVVIENADGSERASHQAGADFPMQSVFKFPIALAVLDRVDRGELGLNQRIFIRPSDLRPGTWSPLRDRYKKGNVSVPLREILRTTIRDSDNNGCDILLRLAGGPKAVTAWLRSRGISGMTVATSEGAMHSDWNIQARNHSTPEAATRLLKRFYDKKLLKPDTQAVLWAAMRDSMVSPERLRNGLPPKTPLIHKTGTSTAFYHKQGHTLNDIGIVILPDGKPVFISVFVSHGKEPKAVTEKMIAALARAAYGHFTRSPSPLSRH